MYELQKNGKVFTSKSVGTGPSCCEKRIYRAAVSQRLRNTGLGNCNTVVSIILYYIIMGPPSYMRSVVDRNVVMKSMTVLPSRPRLLFPQNAERNRRTVASRLLYTLHWGIAQGPYRVYCRPRFYDWYIWQTFIKCWILGYRLFEFCDVCCADWILWCLLCRLFEFCEVCCADCLSSVTFVVPTVWVLWRLSCRLFEFCDVCCADWILWCLLCRLFEFCDVCCADCLSSVVFVVPTVWVLWLCYADFLSSVTFVVPTVWVLWCLLCGLFEFCDFVMPIVWVLWRLLCRLFEFCGVCCADCLSSVTLLCRLFEFCDFVVPTFWVLWRLSCWMFEFCDVCCADWILWCLSCRLSDWLSDYFVVIFKPQYSNCSRPPCTMFHIPQTKR